MNPSLATRTALAMVVLGILGMSDGSRDDGDRFAAARERMLASVRLDVARNRDVLGRAELSPAVEAALAAVPRHEFVPVSIRSRAYENNPLPIGRGQTISQPTIVALMTDLMALAPGDTVLEVGTGSGYQAAVLSEVLDQGYVHTIEIVTDLARTARLRLRSLGYDNVQVIEGDGYAGLPAHAPFDGIMVTAAAPEVPQPLLDQLAPGARLVMPLGRPGDVQWLTVLEKGDDGAVTRRRVLAVRFVPMTGEAERD